MLYVHAKKGFPLFFCIVSKVGSRRHVCKTTTLSSVTWKCHCNTWLNNPAHTVLILYIYTVEEFTKEEGTSAGYSKDSSLKKKYEQALDTLRLWWCHGGFTQ